MLVTALHLQQWANEPAARDQLPHLLRLLIHESGASITEIAIPAGASTNLPGWDGVVLCENGNSWVPKGRSYWEVSCQTDVSAKAASDYSKRTEQTPQEERQKVAFLFVTARQWPGKGDWRTKVEKDEAWRSVRVLDADDLEQWLEQSPATALWLSEYLGLSGVGVESITGFWKRWSHQCSPQITANALLHARASARELLIQLLADHPARLSIRADSTDEAAAFACAIVSEISPHALVVTEPVGWLFVDKNPVIQIAISARAELATRANHRPGLTVVIPYAAGDMALPKTDDRADIQLERPDAHEFEKALQNIGIEEADAVRLGHLTGRSWSVFRRHVAVEPAVRRPAWLDIRESAVLSNICLLGGWTKRDADRTIVSRLAGRPYEEVELDLRVLACIDDPPVLMIADVWKAKSPLELIHLFGDRITEAQLGRFFEISEEILTAPDPVLELPVEERWLANIHGKVRPQSGLLIDSIVDTLVKLAVRGPDAPGLAALHMEVRVSNFVRELLDDADDVRWMSLSSVLRELAEAAPDVFLHAVETSLEKPGQPVAMLLRASVTSGLSGRCWHADLLWALEVLGWASQYLARVALILAKLSKVSIPGNWSNSPKNSLLNLFRSWHPQTAAPVEQRIQVLDRIIRDEPDIAFDLLDGLVRAGPEMAFPAASPRWRDYNCGTKTVTVGDMWKMLHAAADRMIVQAEGCAERLARLVGKITSLNDERRQRVIATLTAFSEKSTDDAAREVVRSALRSYIHWHRNFDKSAPEAVDSALAPLEKIYTSLEPANLLARHAWLFARGWMDLPIDMRRDGHQRDYDLVRSAQRNALAEIVAAGGLDDVDEFLNFCENAELVGFFLRELALPPKDLRDWVGRRIERLSVKIDPFRAMTGALIRCLPDEESVEMIRHIVRRARAIGWNDLLVAEFFSLAQEKRVMWNLVAEQGPEVENAYWSICGVDLWRTPDGADLLYAIDRLIAAERPRTAFASSRLEVKSLPPELVMDMLERISRGEEADGPTPDAYHIADAIEHLELSGVIPANRLVRLEFGLFPALTHGYEATAVSLFKSITTDPTIFTELMQLTYVGKNEPSRDLDEHEQNAARIAYDILGSCHRLPGQQEDGSVDRALLFDFVERARCLCKEADLLDICDDRLGSIIAYAPSEPDGTWPCLPVADLQDQTELGIVREGFLVATLNKRGVTSRAYDEGGDQERNLAKEFGRHAQARHNSHPYLAATLESIASYYQRDAQREDDAVRLRREHG